MYPGTYKEFLWHKEHPQEGQDGGVAASQDGRGREKSRRRAVLDTHERRRESASRVVVGRHASEKSGAPRESTKSLLREQKKRADVESRKRQHAEQTRRAEIDKLEAQIAECEAAIREIEQTMVAPGFYEDRAAALPIVDQHQALMWKVGDLMHRWEELQSAVDLAAEA